MAVDVLGFEVKGARSMSVDYGLLAVAIPTKSRPNDLDVTEGILGANLKGNIELRAGPPPVRGEMLERSVSYDALISGERISIGVIIATKERPAVLDGTLRTLLEQTVAPKEIIVVDSGATDETKKLVAGYAERTQDWTHWLYLHVFTAGAGASRNAGIAQSASAILIFLDDDVILEPTYLEELLKVYRDYPRVGAVSGIITNYNRPPLRNRLFQQWFYVGPFRDERLAIYWNANKLRQAAPIPIRKMTGCVMSVRRSALGERMFDPHYAGAGAEDVDLSWRISESCPILLAPRARLAHLRTESGPARDHWLTAAATAAYYLYYRLWNRNARNGVCFLWLNSGFIGVAALSSIRRGSLLPFRLLLSGVKRARRSLAASVSAEPKQKTRTVSGF